MGIYDRNARWYSPSLRRFLSADSLLPGAGNPQAFNRYAYALNNPIRYTDPSGHCVWDLCITETAVAIVAGIALGTAASYIWAQYYAEDFIDAVEDLITGFPTGGTPNTNQAPTSFPLAEPVASDRLIAGPSTSILNSSGVTAFPLEPLSGQQTSFPLRSPSAYDHVLAADVWQVGIVKDLRRESVRDGCDVHHCPQAHPAEQVVPGYDAILGPGIIVPENVHRRLSRRKGDYKGSARSLMAEDIAELRRSGAPSSSLRDLLNLARHLYPEAFRKGEMR